MAQLNKQVKEGGRHFNNLLSTKYRQVSRNQIKDSNTNMGGGGTRI